MVDDEQDDGATGLLKLVMVVFVVVVVSVVVVVVDAVCGFVVVGVVALLMVVRWFVSRMLDNQLPHHKAERHRRKDRRPDRHFQKRMGCHVLKTEFGIGRLETNQVLEMKIY